MVSSFHRKRTPRTREITGSESYLKTTLQSLWTCTETQLWRPLDKNGICMTRIGLLIAESITYFYFFSSACTDRRRGGTQLSVSSKVGGLEKGHPLSSEGVCHGVAPSFSWSSSRSPAGVLDVVCPEGGLVYRHTCDVSEPLDLLLFDVL